MSGAIKTIFVTGATGYIGGVVVEKAVAQGYQVRGLSRNEQGDAKITALGAVPVRGDLSTLDVLAREAAAADAVLQLAYIHDFTLDPKIVLAADKAATDAMCEALRSTPNKPFIATSGTGFVQANADGSATSEDGPPTTKEFALKHRIESENNILRWGREEGVRAVVIRLPRYVYGRGGSFFAPMLIQQAIKLGEALYIGDGAYHAGDVHVDDAADLYLLAMNKAAGGEIFNGTSSGEPAKNKEVAEAIATLTSTPSRSVAREEAVEKWGGFLTGFVDSENNPSNQKAVDKLGWKPSGVDFLTDLREGSYVAVAEKMKAGSKA